jgi:hypothetical protein
MTKTSGVAVAAADEGDAAAVRATTPRRGRRRGCGELAGGAVAGAQVELVVAVRSLV